DEILLRWVLILLVSWNDPLHHLVTKLQDMKRASNALPSKAKEIEEDNKVLQEGTESITGKIHPGIKENMTTACGQDFHHCSQKTQMPIKLLLITCS
ncbi:PRL, partial [Cervus elaphus hippelaphus]